MPARAKQALKRLHGVNDTTISLAALRELPRAAREGEWVVTALTTEAVRHDRRIVSGFQAGDTTSRQYAVAVDVGTTTVEIALVDLTTGDVVAGGSEYNSQIARGEDVISRVIAASKPGGLDDLNALVVGTLRELVERSLAEAGVSADDLVAYYVAGNTVMAHLLLGISPEFIRTSPYVPAAAAFPWMRASDLGLPGGARDEDVRGCRARRAGWAATSSPDSLPPDVPWTDRLTLFIDVGTNGEIVLGNSEWLVVVLVLGGPGVRGRRHPARHARR